MEGELDRHDQNRKKVCIICYEKGKRPISDVELNFIQDVLIDGYTMDNLDFPCGICDQCHFIIRKKIIKEDVVLPTVKRP